MLRGKIFMDTSDRCYIVETLCRDYFTDQSLAIIRELFGNNRVWAMPYDEFKNCFTQIDEVEARVFNQIKDVELIKEAE